jgi:outer membrane receptor protein involved in Fe transport
VQPLLRDGALAEPHHNDIYNGRLSIDHRIGDTRLLSVTSWTAQEVDSTLDATAAAAGFGLSGPLLFNDDRRYRLFNQELRASGGGDQLRWLAGLSYLHAVTRLDAELLPVGQSSSITVDRMHQTNSEWAAFGEVSVALGRHVRFDLGARLFRAIAVDERQESSGNQTYTRKHTGFTPSASLSWQAGEQTFAYLRYAAAYRPSGLSPFVSADAGAFSPDELSAAELGLRWHSRDRRVRASATGYFNTWSHIQSDYFLANGLVATRNSGMGHIYGLEAKLDWDTGAGWQLVGGIDYQHARLERPEPGLLLTDDHALPIVPPYKAHLALHRDFALGSFTGRGGARLVAIGPSHLSLDPALDRRTGARREVELSVSLASGGWSLGLDLANVLDSRADTFSFGNPFSASSQSQCTPMRPRTLRLTVARMWR